ncbi:hypothetical protein [Cognataquiflexum rubidum]|uniref:hypothetical protein n=1 Tax=Cognataquiflexum rubidum TaxID=2922273 RepID=UPI001F1419DD|nr:hypothetical protein [Cognataquiflexum rubidum]MCH6235812.1 hypothetical protein [Cognataquiflexum rubidum]
MKIIGDTNIWYYIGKDKELFEKTRTEPISPTFVNIYELSKSDNILNNEELSRLAIQKLFAFKTNVIYEPPFIYIAKLHNEIEFDVKNEIGGWLNFTEKFAKGHSIEASKRDDFKKVIDGIRGDLNSGAEFFNEEAEKIRQRLKDKTEHKRTDTFLLTSGFINFIVETTTAKKCNLDGFNIDKIELLIRTLDYFFKTLETSRMKIMGNDWFDFSILAYIQPGDKYWTFDKKWLTLIKDAGCEDYLYKNK